MDQEECLAQTVSSTFCLQLNEFQVERTPHQFVEEKCEALATKISSAIRKAKIKHTVPLGDTSFWSKSKIVFPLTYLQQIIKNSEFGKASYAWAPCQKFTSLKTEVIDGKVIKRVYLEIPESVYGERGFLNLQYPLKRAHYMCSCITILSKTFEDGAISFVSGAHEDLLFPNLLITEGDVSVHLIFSGVNLAKPSRFALSQGNFRPTIISPDYKSKELLATPRYNQRVLRTMLELSLMEEIQSSIWDQPNLREALNLLKAWFKSRDLLVFDDMFISSFMLHLLEKSKIRALHQSWVTMKNFLFALEEWCTSEVVSLETEKNTGSDHSEFLKVFDIVLLDRTGTWNIASDITFDDLNKVKNLIVASIPHIGNYQSFEKLFKIEEDFRSSYDEYFRLYLSSTLFENVIKEYVEDVVDWKDRLLAFTRTIQKVVRTAMGERYEHFRCYVDYKNDSWRLNENKSGMPVDMFLVIGFKIRKEWNNPLTVGPVANDPSAKEFRSFWGKKSELRKFADTRICECVVWAEKSSHEIGFEIMKFLSQEKFKIHVKNLNWLSEVPEMLRSDKVAYDKLGVAYASLSRLLRSLKELPLEITNIGGVNPYLRYAEPLGNDMISTQYGRKGANSRVPDHVVIPKFVPSLEVHVKMVYSSKWGDEVEMVNNLTTAFYLKIAESLRELNYVAVATSEELLVVQDDIVFKIIIVSDRLQLIFGRQKKALVATLAPRVETSDVALALKNLEIKYMSGPGLSASIYSFSRRFAVFSDAVQLTKLWLGYQLLSSYIDDYAIEMIVCAAIKDMSFNTPESPWAAFRKVLHFLATYPWVSSPLILDFDQTWKEDQIAELEQKFLKFRPVLPPMVIMNNHDTDGTKWTHNGPTPVIINRITALAKICFKEMDESMLNANKFNLMKTLFKPNTSSYDAVVHFTSKAVTRNQARPKPDNLKLLPVVDFDPFHSLALRLKSVLEPVALVFFNKYGGEEVYIKFKPEPENQKFAVSKCTFKKMENDCLVLNKEEVVETIKVIGRGLVKDVRILKK
ncbi:unnamed protein product [Auanema sp. JU1783]|nr:unnamed protein product [Auanema sp. JU1783]